MDRCFYCQKEAGVEAFRNPNTEEIHPTCEQCKKELTSFRKETLFFGKAGCLWIPLFILGTIMLTFFHWQWGLFGLIACITLEIIAIRLHSHYLRKKQIVCGTYVDPKSIRWCKTCKHRRKVRKYDDVTGGIWRSDQLPSNAQIPCKIVHETMDVWRSFFSLAHDKRPLLPKDCPKWIRR